MAWKTPLFVGPIDPPDSVKAPRLTGSSRMDDDMSDFEELERRFMTDPAMRRRWRDFTHGRPVEIFLNRETERRVQVFIAELNRTVFKDEPIDPTNDDEVAGVLEGLISTGLYTAEEG